MNGQTAYIIYLCREELQFSGRPSWSGCCRSSTPEFSAAELVQRRPGWYRPLTVDCIAEINLYIKYILKGSLNIYTTGRRKNVLGLEIPWQQNSYECNSQSSTSIAHGQHVVMTTIPKAHFNKKLNKNSGCVTFKSLMACSVTNSSFLFHSTELITLDQMSPIIVCSEMLFFLISSQM